jgi:hypothetical protein
MAIMREDPNVRTRIALAVGVFVWLSAVGAAAAPKVFVRGFRGPQAGDVKSGVAKAIRGSVEVVGSARAADAIVDGSVDKKGLSWVLSVTVRDGGGKALGGRSYPMPAPRVDPSTAERLRRDIASLAARGSKGGGGATARAEPEPKAPKAAKAPPRKVAKVTRADDEKPRKGGKRSAADDADDADDEKPRKGAKRSAADDADDAKPRKETAAQRRAREKQEKAERAAQARREKAERAAQARREKEEKARLAREARSGPGKAREAGRPEPQVRGTVSRQADDDEATDILGPKEKRADAKAAKARQEQAERDRKARKLAEANEKLARAQAEAKRQREEDQRRKAEEAAARRAEEQARREEQAAARRSADRRARIEREEARRQKLAEEEERRAEARRAREAERRSRDEEEERRTEARRTKRRSAADDEDRGSVERDTGRRVARRAEAEEEAESSRRPARRDDDDPPRRASDDDDSARRSRSEASEERVRKPAPKPTAPGRGPANLGAGVLLGTRHFELSPKGAQLPVYDAAFYPSISLEGELYPLGLAGLKAGRDLGVFLRYDRLVGLTSHEPDPASTSGALLTFNNSAQRVEGGILYRLHTGSAGIAPVVRPMVAVGYQSFTVGKTSTMPETAYTYVALGLGFYVPIGHPNFGAVSTVRYHIIVGLGDVGGFGSAWTAWGVDLSVGLRLFVIKSLEVCAAYYYERVEMTFQGVGPLSKEVSPSAGSDVYQGGRITLSYHF